MPTNIESIESVSNHDDVKRSLIQLTAAVHEMENKIPDILRHKQNLSQSKIGKLKHTAKLRIQRLKDDKYQTIAKIEQLSRNKQLLEKQISQEKLKRDTNIDEIKSIQNIYKKFESDFKETNHDWRDCIATNRDELENKYREMLNDCKDWEFNDIKKFIQKVIDSTNGISEQRRELYLNNLEKMERPSSFFGDIIAKITLIQYKLDIQNERDWESITSYIKQNLNSNS